MGLPCCVTSFNTVSGTKWLLRPIEGVCCCENTPEISCFQLGNDRRRENDVVSFQGELGSLRRFLHLLLLGEMEKPAVNNPTSQSMPHVWISFLKRASSCLEVPMQIIQAFS